MKQMIFSAAAVFLMIQAAPVVRAVEPATPGQANSQDTQRVQPALPPRLQNVQLSTDHRLAMQLVNAAGEPLPGIPVIVSTSERQQPCQRLVSDANGELTAQIRTGGTVVIQIV